MKTIILENTRQEDIPEEITEILQYQFLSSEREYWTHFHDAYHPENRHKTAKRFSSLQSGDNLICGTVFDGTAQIEVMIEILQLLKMQGIKLNFFIFAHGTVCETLAFFKIRNGKDNQNVKALDTVLDYHNIYEITNLAYYECDDDDFIGKCIKITSELLNNEYIFNPGEKVKLIGYNDTVLPEIFTIESQYHGQIVYLKEAKGKRFKPTDLKKI